MENNNGCFVISLDFELFWGVRDSRTLEEYGKNILGVRQAMPAMLKLFEEFDIKVTFATVGFLFCHNKDEIVQHTPSLLPDYPDKKYSPFENNYIAQIGNDEKADLYHYGASLVHLIQSSPQHEIATHTFSHYYCLEGSSIESFKADLAAAKKIAETYNVELKSIVFPRNQYAPAHLEICREMGLTSYRGNEASFVYQPRKYSSQNYFIKILRLVDAYFNLFGHHCVFMKKNKELPVNIPASRFLRPFNRKLQFLENFKVQRIKKSMTFAAKKNMLFHLWWHPHNFGSDLDKNLKNLTEILKHYRTLNQQYNFQSITMKQLADKINMQ